MSIQSDNEYPDDDDYDAILDPTIDPNDPIFKGDNPLKYFAGRPYYYSYNMSLEIDLNDVGIFDSGFEEFWAPRTITVSDTIEFIESVVSAAQSQKLIIHKIVVPLKRNYFTDDGLIRIVDFLKELGIPFELDLTNSYDITEEGRKYLLAAQNKS